ncbi:ATP-dependent helicase, partial [Clostridium botulinum]|nr:ATP-dependent helicase [Clostridium botulinum]
MNKIELLPHQVKALDQTKGMSRVAYYLDMGLGKTFVAGEKAEILGNDIILIVCQKSKLEDWKDHYQTYYPHYNVIIYNKELEKVDPGTVLIINYDLVWRRSQLKKLKNVTLILDE